MYSAYIRKKCLHSTNMTSHMQTREVFSSFTQIKFDANSPRKKKKMQTPPPFPLHFHPFWKRSLFLHTQPSTSGKCRDILKTFFSPLSPPPLLFAIHGSFFSTSRGCVAIFFPYRCSPVSTKASYFMDADWGVIAALYHPLFPSHFCGHRKLRRTLAQMDEIEL